MTDSVTVFHVGEPVDDPWATLPDGARTVESVRGIRDRSDDPAAVLVRLDGDASTLDDGDSVDRDLERVASLAAAVPVIAYTTTDDTDAAIDASRAGAEYVSGRRLASDGDTLADRTAALIEREADHEPPDHAAIDPDHEPPDDREAFLESFLRVTTDRGRDFEEKLDDLIAVGRDYLGLEIGFASRITGDRFHVIDQQGADDLMRALMESDLPDKDGSIPLATTYCRRTVEDDGLVAFTDPEAAGWDDDPAVELFGFETYIGGRVVAGDDVVGTFCFADEERRDRSFTDTERLFVELLADWLGNELDRQRALEERAETTERLENTLERIGDGFFALDDDWRFTYVNERAARLLDRDPEALVGENVWAAFPDALGRKYERNYRRAMERQEAVSFEDYYEPLDLWTEVNAYPSAAGLSVFFTDVTDRKRREETLRDLLRTSERFQLVDDPERTAERLVGAASEALGYDINGVRLYDAEHDVLELVAMSDGLRERFDGREPRDPNDGIVGRVFASGDHEVCADLAALDDDRDYRGVRSVVAVPLSTHGVLTVGSTEPDTFDESDVSVVQLLATNATAALDRIDRQQRLHTYERALENVDDMVCVLNEQGQVTYMTRPLARWLGAKRVELVGRRLSEVLPGTGASVEAALNAIRADDETVDGGGPELRVDGDTVTLPLTVSRVDGGTRRGELRLSTLGGRAAGTVGSVTDTTELTRARTERDRERDRFTRLFEELPDPVMEVALKPDVTVIQQVNDAFAAQFGYDSSTIRGRSIAELDIGREQPAGNGPDDRSLDERVREEGSVTDEVRRRTTMGPREFLFRGFSYDTTDGPHAFGIYTDITEQKHRERYLQLANRILRHNLRNELNVVFGFASEIANRTDDERIADFANRIETTGRRLSELGEGAAEIKRIVEGGLASELKPIGVCPIAERVATTYGEAYPAATVDVSVPAGTAVRADERLEDVLDHLVENAIVHAEHDAPTVEIGVHDRSDGFVAITVADDGPGIPEGIRGIVSGDKEVTQLRHNSGIGLWIVAWVVASYGGDITFGPGIDGQGTAVELRIPGADATASAASRPGEIGLDGRSDAVDPDGADRSDRTDGAE